MSLSKRGYVYHWRPDVPDFRDLTYSAPRPVMRALPPAVDLRKQCPEVYNQGQLGSCTANAIAAAHQFDQLKQGAKDVFNPSRLFIYYNERAMEGTIDSDAGAMIRDGFKSIAKQGVCKEISWPYDPAKFTKKPLAGCYKEALNHQSLQYMRLAQTDKQLRGCLGEGFPFVFGIAIYESFESDAVAKTGVVPMPKAGEKSLGGHAIMCVGYQNAKKRFIIRNSWGPGWGDKGYFYLPYEYVLNDNLSCDFWTMRSIEV